MTENVYIDKGTARTLIGAGAEILAEYGTIDGVFADLRATATDQTIESVDLSIARLSAFWQALQRSHGLFRRAFEHYKSLHDSSVRLSREELIAILNQLEWCNLENEAGYLVNNVAFQRLVEVAQPLATRKSLAHALAAAGESS